MVQLSTKILGILFLGTSLLQAASCWDHYTPPPESDHASRSSSQGLSTQGKQWNCHQNPPPDASPYCTYAEQSSGDESPPPMHLPPATSSACSLATCRHEENRAAQLFFGFRDLQLAEASQDPLSKFISALVAQREPLSPCAAANRLRMLGDGDFHKLNLAAAITPQSVILKLSSDLEAIAESTESMCRSYLMATGYQFSQRPTEHLGHTFLWTVMNTLGIRLEDERKPELGLVKFFERVYRENIARGPIDDHRVLSESADQWSSLRGILNSWGSSFELSRDPENLSLVLELFVGGPHTTGLLKFGHDACRYTHHLKGLSPRMAPQTPIVQRVVFTTDNMQECA